MIAYTFFGKRAEYWFVGFVGFVLLSGVADFYLDNKHWQLVNTLIGFSMIVLNAAFQSKMLRI